MAVHSKMSHLDIGLLSSYLDRGLISKNSHERLPIFIWNYTPKTQYERLWDEVTLLCRCLVTDHRGNILARSFKKFFNIEEHTHLPNEPFEVYEKLDGSLILVFYYKDELVVSSRGSFHSEHSDGAQRIIKKYDTGCLNKKNSYCFELIAPWNRIVCDYGDEEKLVLLAKFDPEGKEYTIEEYSNFFPIAKKFDFSSLNEIKNSIPLGKEGYVVKFKNGERIKVKGEDYVRLHKIISMVSESSILELISRGQNKELMHLLSSLPDEHHKWAKETLLKLESRFEAIKAECESKFRNFHSRKQAASYFLTQRYPQVLFRMLDNRDFNDMIWNIVRMETKSELRKNSRD